VHDTTVIHGRTYWRSWATAAVSMAEEVPGSPLLATAGDAFRLDQNNPDLVWVKFTLDAEGANRNWDFMPRRNLIYSVQTAHLKPFDMEHVIEETGSMHGATKYNVAARNTIHGVMTHATIADATGLALTDKEIAKLSMEDDLLRPEEEKLTIVAHAALWGYRFPQTVAETAAKIQEGKIHVSMERLISHWDLMVYGEDGELYTVPSDAAMQIGETPEKTVKSALYRKWESRTTHAGMPIYRRAIDSFYTGVGAVKVPAQPMSRFLAIDSGIPSVAHAKLKIFNEIASIQTMTDDAPAVSTIDTARQRVANRIRLMRAAAAMTGQIE